MKTEDLFSTLLSYIRRHILGIVIYVVFAVVFYLVFILYNLNTSAVEYAIMLTAGIGFVIVAIDFCFYWRKHNELRKLIKSISFSLDDLPQAADTQEKDYQALLSELFDYKKRLAFEADVKNSELVEYFTLWAHQIKTPISAIHLLLQSENSPENNELSMELFRIEQYVEMVLQYLRMKDMSSDLVLHRYALADIIRQAVRKYARLFILKKITLDFREPDCDVLTDEKWLVFVIEQLLSNALKYTQRGTISIYMKPDAEKTLVIRDTGIGIQEEDLPRIFEKGFTGYNGRMDKKSTGIGLYLCKQILNRLSHTITVTSVVGEGTAFEMDLSSSRLEVE